MTFEEIVSAQFDIDKWLTAKEEAPECENDPSYSWSGSLRDAVGRMGARLAVNDKP